MNSKLQGLLLLRETFYKVPSLCLTTSHLAVGLCLEVLVQLFVKPLVVLDASDVVQPPLAHLLSESHTHCQDRARHGQQEACRDARLRTMQ